MPQSTMRTARSKKFMGIISLRTATEFIIFAFLINKVSGLYGFLALFTGYELNALQLSMYLSSILTLGLGLYLSPHIRRPKNSQSAVHVLALAWLYLLDTLLNVFYTLLFGAGWFKMLAIQTQTTGHLQNTAGKPALVDTAHLGHGAHFAVVPDAGSSSGHDPVSLGVSLDSAALGRALVASGSWASIVVIALLYVVRFYACVLVVAFARAVSRRHAGATAEVGTPLAKARRGREGEAEGVAAGSSSSASRGTARYERWREGLAKVMTAVPSTRFWLGDAENDDWFRRTSDKFKSSERR